VEILKSAIQGNEQLSKELGVTIADSWTEFGVEPLNNSLNRLNENQNQKGWCTYFPIHKKDSTLIGSSCYKDIPTKEGIVEIGYEIAPDYRNKGYATEVVNGLILNAYNDKRVKLVIAHTLREENASTKVLIKCGFEKTEEINDPEDGLIWRWERKL